MRTANPSCTVSKDVIGLDTRSRAKVEDFALFPRALFISSSSKIADIWGLKNKWWRRNKQSRTTGSCLYTRTDELRATKNAIAGLAVDDGIQRERWQMTMEKLRWLPGRLADIKDTMITSKNRHVWMACGAGPRIYFVMFSGGLTFVYIRFSASDAAACAAPRDFGTCTCASHPHPPA